MGFYTVADLSERAGAKSYTPPNGEELDGATSAGLNCQQVLRHERTGEQERHGYFFVLTEEEECGSRIPQGQEQTQRGGR